MSGEQQAHLGRLAAAAIAAEEAVVRGDERCEDEAEMTRLTDRDRIARDALSAAIGRLAGPHPAVLLLQDGAAVVRTLEVDGIGIVAAERVYRIALGLKGFETRAWWTPYRGLVLVHAGKRWTEAEARVQWAAVHHLRAAFGADDPRSLAFEGRPPRRCVVAIADLVECWAATDLCRRIELSDMEQFFGDFAPLRYAWQLENVIALPEPVPCRGSQGLWTPPADVVDAVVEQLGRAAR